MGCLNSTSAFSHVFGNIHLSGPCNRKCYFCIGQHMMALDSENNLDTWPLTNIDKFVEQCLERGVKEVNLTGTNTDPLLYKHAGKLTDYLRKHIPGVKLGIRTNGVHSIGNYWWYDKMSVSVCSLDGEINKKMMGGQPGAVEFFANTFGNDFKVNIILGPENTRDGDLFRTLKRLVLMGVTRVNLREPYGQPHIGDPMASLCIPSSPRLGMPVYQWGPMEVTYWDVHYVEVESVNLYANGRVSSDYPITRGHAESGEVHDQSFFPGGRVREQWMTLRRK